MFNARAHPIAIVRSGWLASMECEADCACPIVQPRSAFVPTPRANVRYQPAAGLVTQPLNANWWFAFQPHSPVVPVVLNEAANSFLTAGGTRLNDMAARALSNACAPAEQIFLRELIESELVVPEDYVPTPPLAADTLTAWIHVTNACNLRCPYCYLDKTRDAMTLDTGERALESVLNAAARHHYRRVKLKYAGGEPTLQFSLVTALARSARTLAEKLALELKQVVLSNGTRLDASRIRQLQELDVKLMISLDGIGAAHDAQRPFADGRSSFARVAENIECCLAQSYVPDISITVSRRNLPGLYETVRYCLERDLPFSLNLYRENDCSASVADLRLDEAELIQGLLQVYRLIEENLPQRSLLGSLSDRASFLAPHAHACGAGHDYLVIDHHGRIAKCQMDFKHTVADVHANDALEMLRSHPASIRNIGVDEKEGCRECEWRYWCAGGCPLATFRATGRYDVKSPNCNIYKALYPQVLRLEALRLLREYTRVQDTRSMESSSYGHEFC